MFTPKHGEKKTFFHRDQSDLTTDTKPSSATKQTLSVIRISK